MLLADNSPPFQASLRYFSEFELYSTSMKWTRHLLVGGSVGNRLDIDRIVKALKDVNRYKCNELIQFLPAAKPAGQWMIIGLSAKI